MTRLCATAAAVLMLGGFGLAQSPGSTGGLGGTAGTSTPGAPGPSVPGANPAPKDATVPLGTTLPGGSPSPSDDSTVGRGPGINPSNPQDLVGRSNRQDLTGPRGRNPQDADTGNPPPIMVPER